VPVMAQNDPGADHPIFGRAQQAVAQFLQLSEDQVNQWDILIADHHAVVEPLREQRRTAAEELRALLEADPPDATAIGEKVIEIHGIDLQLRDANQTYVAAFEALLDEEQTGRLGFIRRAAHAEPLIPAFRATGLLAPPPADGGGDDQPAPVGPGAFAPGR
jgi:Spy/CpxP family protein refolding chaperone